MVELLACEAVTSLGECAAETALFLDAGVVNVGPSRFVAEDGARVAMCAAPALPPHLLGIERLAALFSLAIDRLAMTRQALGGASTVLLCLPERMAVHEGSFDLRESGRELVCSVENHPRLRGLSLEVFPFGRAAGALSLQRAYELVSAGQRVIWGGVDSQHDWSVLQRLIEEDRLLTEDNVDGLRPGEAAAFSLLQRADGRGNRPIIIGLGLGRQAAINADLPAIRAEGLARAVQCATTRLRDGRRRCGYWLFDTTHEDLATQRLQHVLTACADIVGTSTALHAPLQRLGDAGAASLPLFAALADQAWRSDTADDDTALLAACSDSGACGAMLLAESFAVSAV